MTNEEMNERVADTLNMILNELHLQVFNLGYRLRSKYIINLSARIPSVSVR